MDIDRILKCAAAALITCAILAGCGTETAHWAYNHEPDKEVLTLKGNGRAVFAGQEYTYTQDDKVIILTDASGASQSHRYAVDGDTMTFYESGEYSRDAAGDGIVGVWVHTNGRNSFQFTQEGTFSEDSIFHGHYSVDEAEGTIKLMYDDPLEDAILYYERSGDSMVIDYPWTMVRTQSK